MLAMPKVKDIRPHVLKRLEALKKQGGKVIESVPVTAEALQSAGIGSIVSNTSCSIRWKARQLNDGMLFFLSNFQKTGTFEATLRVSGKATGVTFLRMDKNRTVLKVESGSYKFKSKNYKGKQ